MGRINSIEKITSNWVDNIQRASLKAVQGQIEDTVKFFVGTVVNIDTLNGRAKVRYMRTDGSSYTDIECTIKTDEIIKLNDIVIVLYIRNLSNSFVFGKMTSSYYSKLGNYTSQESLNNILKNYYVTLDTNQTIAGAKTFSNASTFNDTATFNATGTTFNQKLGFINKANPYIEMTTKDGNDTEQTYYVQSYQGKAGIGPGWGKSTIWDENGNVTFPSIPTVNNKNVAVFDDVGSGGHSGDSGYGGYIRFTNGIQICWDYYPIGTFTTGTRTMSFSKSFAASTTPIVLINPVTNRGSASYDRETCPNTISNTGATITWNTGISYTGYCMVALGTWQ